MGHWFSIDVDEMHMFARYQWRDLGDECGHDCEHRSTAVIGWGPDLSTYELIECSDCKCRTFCDGRYVKARQRHEDSGFWWSLLVWRASGEVGNQK